MFLDKKEICNNSNVYLIIVYYSDERGRGAAQPTRKDHRVPIRQRIEGLLEGGGVVRHAIARRSGENYCCFRKGRKEEEEEKGVEKEGAGGRSRDSSC